MSGPETPKRAVMFTVAPSAVELFEAVLRERGHKLVGIVTAPGPRTRRTDDYTEVVKLARPGLDVIISNYPTRWADMIRPLKPDLIFCVGFNWKIPADVLDVPPLGAFNAHDSLLPRNRGMNSLGWALRTGEPVYGITVHCMTVELDNGPILSQREVTISDDEDSDDMFPRFLDIAAEVFAEALDRILEGHPGTPQDEAEATYTPGAFDPEWRELDWNHPVRDVFFQIRSWFGDRDVPRGAFGTIDGQRMLITKAKPARDVVVQPGTSPGTVISRNDQEILVMCADGPLRIINWEAGPACGPKGY